MPPRLLGEIKSRSLDTIMTGRFTPEESRKRMRAREINYDYTVSGTPATPATGSPNSTGVVVTGLTASGQVSNSREFTGSQNVRGSVRKATGSPYYKSVAFTDVVNQTAGLTKTIQMILDE